MNTVFFTLSNTFALSINYFVVSLLYIVDARPVSLIGLNGLVFFCLFEVVFIMTT